VSEQRWFCRSEKEWDAIAERLKQTPCPHCQAVGTLNRHGFLRGYDEGDSQRKAIRARRIFCSNRYRRRGCGRTFSVWLADKIRRLSVTTHALWRFLQHAVAGSITAACRGVADCRRSDRTWQRIWKRFHLSQSKLRTALSAYCPPPEPPAKPSRRPATQVVAHLRAAFPDANCPITDFQHSTRTFFR
jgi:hypothetical protein